MSNLQSLQNKFQHYLMHDTPGIERLIIGTENVPIATRLGVYQNAYRLRLLEALASNYPCLQTYIGEEEFHRIGHEYITAHPSSYRSIRWFGDQFPDFLLTHYIDRYPCLAELAEFEWKMTQAFDEADITPFKMEQMATIPPDAWGNMRFTAHPSLHQMHFFWNVVSLWEALANKETTPSPQKNPASSSWILWRQDYIIRFYGLAPEESWAINGMIAGLTFGELCEGLCTFIAPDEVGMRAASLLKGWIQSGILTNITS
ncbi:MAG: DNA-binding domain-containing protein [Legionella sp.]|nr:DNA-binding domain-containing protein [Legionella sp.]